MTLRVGTRGSALARVQTAIVTERIPVATETVVIRTSGDVTDRPIPELGDGAFVAAIEEALRRGEIDVAVHSLKDLPTGDRPGLVLAAILEREDPRDVLVTRARGGLATLPRGASVGTSSPRRDAFLRALRPDIASRPIRGNVDTRLRKVRDGEYDATVLALAGLRRLGAAITLTEKLAHQMMEAYPGAGSIQRNEEQVAQPQPLQALFGVRLAECLSERPADAVEHRNPKHEGARSLVQL